jgi:hypothetical protein
MSINVSKKTTATVFKEGFMIKIYVVLYLSDVNLISYKAVIVVYWRSWSSSCGRQSVDQFILVSGSLWYLRPDFIFFFFSFDNYFVVLPRAPSPTEDGSVVYSAIAAGQVSDDQ